MGSLMYEFNSAFLFSTARNNARRPILTKKEFAEMRKLADNVFLQGMNATEPLVASWKKYSAYYAVRLFGRFAIKSSAPRTW